MRYTVLHITMRPRYFLFTILLIVFLIVIPIQASLVESITIGSSGLIRTMEDFKDSKNLAQILGVWGGYDIYGKIVYNDPDKFPQITHADFSVTHNGNPSIRIDQSIPANPAREVNHRWVRASPGDHVVFRCWIKTGNPKPNGLPIGYGGILGVDLYGPSGRLWEVHPRTIQSEVWKDNYPGHYDRLGSPIYVPYNSDWMLLTLDFIIPNTYFDHTDYGVSVSPQQVIGMIPWLGMSHNPDLRNEDASGWFADAVLYINP